MRIRSFAPEAHTMEVTEMRPYGRLALTILVLALGAGIAAAQTLTDVAKKEKTRRDKNKSEPTRTITERELAGGFGSLPASPATSSSTGGAEAAEAAAGAEGETPAEQDETKTQQYWQNRAKGAKDKIAKLEQQLNSDDWGEGQRVGVDPRGLNNLNSRQKAEQDLAAARSELAAIQAEARRAGVPPGWVR
jgi:hypothetical protein